METLLYAEEHRSCLNYRIPHVAAIKVEQFPGDSAYHIIDTHEATLFFMLEGEAYITSNNYKNILHRNGYMSLQPANSSCYVRITKPSTVISCHFSHATNLCERYSLQQLSQFIPQGFEYNFTLLPIRERLNEYLVLLQHCLNDGLGCLHFHELKTHELFILLRAYYSKEELATFFYPIIGKNQDFKDFVYANYLKVNNLNEFATLAHTSVDTFKRRFKETFNEPVHKWITHRKAEHIYRDIVLTNKSLGELAEQYHFSSVAYLSTFCRQHLGRTPQQLRNEREQSII